jgi:hypothetical protein
MDVNVFDSHCLFATTPKLGQHFRLRGVRSQKLHRQIPGRV